jgi:hypothetical protein
MNSFAGALPARISAVSLSSGWALPIGDLSMSEENRSKRWSRIAGIVAASSLAILSTIVVASPASANSETGLITISPATPAAQPAGTPTTYSIAISCEGTAGTSCGGSSDPTITIPLTGTNTVPANMSAWTYSATSGTTGLIDSGPTVVSNGSGGYNLVLDVNNAMFVSGFSGTITLKVTPPNDTTPDHTTWSLSPTLAGGNMAAATAPTAATGEATATPLPVVTKVTDDGGNVYIAGTDVTYDITTACNAGTSGNLYLSSGSLIDPLPAGMTYVSSSPSGASYDAGSNTVTWTFANAASTPTGCASGSSGATSYQVVAAAPNPAPSLSSQPLRNIATFSGVGPDAVNGTVSGSTDAQADIDVIQTAPTGACSGAGCPTISKSSLAPLAIASLPGNQYQGTYPGNWVTTSPTATYTVGAASGSYQVNVDFPLTHTYETDIEDPLPCLADVSGDTYSSPNPTASACADPAFHPTVIEVSGPGVGQAVASGWAPTTTLAGGSSTVALTPTGSVSTGATSAHYSIPSGDITTAATIDLPPTAQLEGDAITLTVWGYGDSSLVSPDVLDNTATATPFLDGGTQPLGSITASANLYIVNPTVQLGVSKSFGTLGGGPGGTTVLNVEGAVSFPSTLSNDVVLTDLLPSGMSWANAAASGSFSLTRGAGASTTSVTATASYLQNYEGSERNLIRVTIPHGDFTSADSWTITPPTDFFELATPTVIGTYPNTDQIFLDDFAPTQTDQTCTTPTQTSGGITPATLESYDPMNLAGDGQTQEDYCQAGATLVVEPSGAAFNLTKTVQGNLDPAPEGALSIGDASPGGSGTGTYVLSWANVGSDTLDDPVIYDILPYIGDTGVSQGQATVARDSQFAPTFASVGSPPSGVTVEYSQSTNPCRNQVYPNSANTSCVNDWSTTAPTNPSNVKALEFVDDTNEYLSGSSFSVSFTVTVPNGDVNEVAWNSAATDATDVSEPSVVPLPAEPPKVGLTAVSGSPSLTTTTSTASVQAYSTTAINDTVTILGTAETSGTLAWSLVGPVASVSSSCTAVSWTGAATVASGSTATPAYDTVLTVGPASVQGQGCYSWTETLTLPGSGGTATSAAGSQTSELVQALPYATTLATTATPVYNGTNNASTDAITVSNSGIGIGNGAPTSATLTWDLYGPATPVTAGSCAGITWSTLSPLDSGAITVTGDGHYTTTSTDLATDGVGCYTYTDSLPQTTSGNAVSTAQGATTETFILVNAPSATTSANQAEPNPRTSVTDAVTITGTYGNSGTVSWQLVGPVTVPSGGCSAVTSGQWSSATTSSSGTQSFTGNQTAATVPSSGTAAGAPGCYSWAETITGPNFYQSTSVAAGATDEIFQVVPYQPAVATTAAPVYSAGSNTVTDTVVVSNSDLGGSNGAPSSATLTWTLYGPVPNPGTGCSTISNGTWLAATTQTGTKAVTNGTNHTTAVTLNAIGCYTYTGALASTGDTLAVATTSPGVSTETFELVSTQAVSTSANQTSVSPRATVSDSVTITGTSGYHGTAAWQLVGPVTVPVGGCSAVTSSAWSSASVHASGTQAITGDQASLTVPSAGTAAGAPGCYSWADTLTGGDFLGAATVAAGAPNEVFVVQVLQPSLTTTITPTVSSGTESATDTVTVAGTDIAPGNTTGAPTSGTVDWTLYGPVSPVPTNGCAAVTSGQWSAAATAASGAITVTANTAYATPATVLSLGSCYSYAETLLATTDSAAYQAPVGVVTETAEVPAAPVVTTGTSSGLVYPHTSVTDSVTVTGVGGFSGTVTWTLVGPVNPVTAGTCNGVTWSSAPVTPVGQGSIAVSADGTLTTSSVRLDDVGCYSWTDSLSGTFPGVTSISAGAANEVILVQAHQPLMTTTATVTSGAGGTKSVTDTVAVTGSGIATGSQSPTSTPLAWTLYGPVAPVSGACTTVSWGGATAAASGTITVTGDGTYATTATALTSVGCYSYQDSLAATADSAAATVTIGTVSETVLLLAPPTLVTATTESQVVPYTTVSDTVTVTGTGGEPGVVAWSLLGPIEAASDGTCGGLSWFTAPVAESGQTAVTADGNLSTTAKVGGLGCYGWTDTFTGADTLGQTTVSAGTTGELILVDPYQPVLTTASTLSNGRYADTITVSGSALGIAPGTPTSTSLTWTLIGPASDNGGSCPSTTDWGRETVAATGTLTVTGDGTYTTPWTTLEGAGCYTFDEQLSGTALADPASTQPGVAIETAAYLPAAGTVGSDGLGSIGTDLGRWLPGSRTDGAAIITALGATVAGSFAALFVRRRRRA